MTKYAGPDGDVTIPEGVTEIGDYAFSGCTGLTNVTIPEGVKEIHGVVFLNCPRLVVCATAGSYAERYARKNSICFQPLEA